MRKHDFQCKMELLIENTSCNSSKLLVCLASQNITCYDNAEHVMKF